MNCSVMEATTTAKQDETMKTKRRNRLSRFIRDVWLHTPFVRMLLLLMVLWPGFSAALYRAEHTVAGASITNYGEALYRGVAAFSAAGIADTPQSDMARLIGGIWIVPGSALFFGAIVATTTTCFTRPMQRPGEAHYRHHRVQSGAAQRSQSGEPDLLKDGGYTHYSRGTPETGPSSEKLMVAHESTCAVS